MTKEEKYAMVRKYYPTAHLGNLAQRVGMKVEALRSLARRMGLRRNLHVKKPWTERQLNYLKAHYQDTEMEVLMVETEHQARSIHKKAAALGLAKTKEFLARYGYRVSMTEGGLKNRFQKGHIPKNKGKRMEDYMSPEKIEKFRSSQFKPGSVPWQAKPVGYERVNERGYIYVKVPDCRRMVLKHRYIYEQAFGPIPKGHYVRFKDGNRQNFAVENLYLISRADSARRQIQGESPEQRRQRIERCQNTRNKNIRRDKIRLRYGLPPLGNLVKRWWVVK